jgi:hypothetical protein
LGKKFNAQVNPLRCFVARQSRIDLDMLLPQASQTTHFQRNPPGRGQLAVFSRCSLDRYDPDSGTSLAP